MSRSSPSMMYKARSLASQLCGGALTTMDCYGKQASVFSHPIESDAPSDSLLDEHWIQGCSRFVKQFPQDVSLAYKAAMSATDDGSTVRDWTISNLLKERDTRVKTVSYVAFAVMLDAVTGVCCDYNLLFQCEGQLVRVLLVQTDHGDRLSALLLWLIIGHRLGVSGAYSDILEQHRRAVQAYTQLTECGEKPMFSAYLDRQAAMTKYRCAWSMSFLEMDRLRYGLFGNHCHEFQTCGVHPPYHHWMSENCTLLSDSEDSSDGDDDVDEIDIEGPAYPEALALTQ